MHPHEKEGFSLAMKLFRLKVLRRSRAYRAVFKPEALTIEHQAVLADLRDFCRAATSTFRIDPLDAARLQGRREVWLRIVQHLNLDEAKVQQLVEIDDGLGE